MNREKKLQTPYESAHIVTHSFPSCNQDETVKLPNDMKLRYQLVNQRYRANDKSTKQLKNAMQTTLSHFSV